MTQGWRGWDEYADFYDWENARTLGRRDVAFWQAFARGARGPVVELGCGTGRVLVPLARTGVRATGVDRSASMLARAVTRARRVPVGRRPTVVRADIRRLPFGPSSFSRVIAAYGLLQSLLTDRDLDAALPEMSRVVERGGLVGVDLVPDLPTWDEYRRRVRLRGRAERGGHVTLVETVRQDRRRGLTTFDEEFITRRRGRQTRRRFRLVFRTVAVGDLVERLGRVGLAVESIAGDYRGRPWTPESATWLIVARKT
jgi:ubiquinone/menaquinone biosynthesis C-methylase UbiE